MFAHIHTGISQTLGSKVFENVEYNALVAGNMLKYGSFTPDRKHTYSMYGVLSQPSLHLKICPYTVDML